jgi:hypothetical protein
MKITVNERLQAKNAELTLMVTMLLRRLGHSNEVFGAAEIQEAMNYGFEAHNANRQLYLTVKARPPEQQAKVQEALKNAED